MAERGRPRAFDRDAALELAMECFWEYGYEGTSISDLTRAMGINAPSLYAAFGSKEALFRSALGLYATTVGSTTGRALREEPTAREAIEVMLRGNADLHSRPGRSGGCMFVLGAATRSEKNSEIGAFLSTERRKAVAAIESRLERGIADGELPASLDVVAVAAFYASVLHGMSIEARDGVPRQRLDAITDSAMRAWDALVGG